MKLPCIYMRGGTSKGAMLKQSDLPADRALWDDVLIKVMGGPDPKQIDGLGGTVSSNNKIMIVAPSEVPEADVDYMLAQIVVGEPIVDYSANCGNMTAAVGPFSIMSGLVKAEPDATEKVVRMRNLNTGKFIDEVVPVKDGQVVETGDCEIAGIDGTGAELKVNFLNPSGAKTGKLLPTGNITDDIEGVSVSVIDISNVFIFITAADLGMRGDELPEEVNSDKELLERVEGIRGRVAQKLGFVSDWKDAGHKTPGSPKVVLCSLPMDYKDSTKKQVRKEDMDICVRIISMGKMHKACPLTGATAIGGAAYLADSVGRKHMGNFSSPDTVRIGHPCGTMKVYVEHEKNGDSIEFRGVAAQRTSRKIMEGTLYIRED